MFEKKKTKERETGRVTCGYFRITKKNKYFEGGKTNFWLFRKFIKLKKKTKKTTNWFQTKKEEEGNRNFWLFWWFIKGNIF